MLALKPKGKTPLGTSPESLDAVDALETPTPKQATLFARLGRSFASAGLSRPAVTYLRAALRGGEEGVDLRVMLAATLAARADLALDEAWSDEAFEHLVRAVEVDPLSAPARLACGRQMLLRATDASETAAARDMLGLGLVVLRPVDDAKTLAGLYLASDRNEEAAGLYRKLLAERPDAYFLWAHLVRALAADGRAEEAKAAKARALAALDDAPASLAPLRRVLERIPIR